MGHIMAQVAVLQMNMEIVHVITIKLGGGGLWLKQRGLAIPYKQTPLACPSQHEYPEHKDSSQLEIENNQKPN